MITEYIKKQPSDLLSTKSIFQIFRFEQSVDLRISILRSEILRYLRSQIWKSENSENETEDQQILSGAIEDQQVVSYGL